MICLYMTLLHCLIFASSLSYTDRRPVLQDASFELACKSTDSSNIHLYLQHYVTQNTLSAKDISLAKCPQQVHNSPRRLCWCAYHPMCCMRRVQQTGCHTGICGVDLVQQDLATTRCSQGFTPINKLDDQQKKLQYDLILMMRDSTH